MDEREWWPSASTSGGSIEAVAHRMLGSVDEAEDAVQEAWLRLSRADTREVDNLAGWLTTVVARVCLDMLRSRRSRREEALGALAEPTGRRAAAREPESEAVLADAIGPALLVVLDMLAPPNASRSCCTTCSTVLRGDRADRRAHACGDAAAGQPRATPRARRPVPHRPERPSRVGERVPRRITRRGLRATRLRARPRGRPARRLRSIRPHAAGSSCTASRP